MIWSQPLFWLLAAAVAVLMELWAMFLHGQLWHGVLWFGHRSHHTPKAGWWEWNDAFAVGHALIAMGLIIGGLELLHGPVQLVAVAIGMGMSAFGMAYFAVHDGLIHGRLPMQFLLRWDYFRRVRNAHMAHHHKGQAPYGLFLGLQELRWHNKRASRQNQAA
jgi:beta-carotene 3-hydroxylase